MQAPAPRKTFVLGMGCQKGGTSWLYDYLAESPQYAKGYAKEFHVFDAFDVEWERTRGDAKLAAAAAEIAKARRGEPFRADKIHWAAMCGNHDMYYDYFAGLLARRPRFRATGDLTPAYGMLSAERVAEIRERFAGRGVRAVAVFLMRDPVERLWSQARMLDRRNPELYAVPPEDVVADEYRNPRYEQRTRYDHTLRVMDEVFGPGDRWIGFYEELFEGDRIREVSEMVGLDYREPDVETVANPSPKTTQALPDDLVAKVAEHYREVYEAVAARFPETDLPRLWPSARHVL